MAAMTVALGATIALPRTTGACRTRVTATARASPTSRIAPRVANTGERRRHHQIMIRTRASDNPGAAPSLSVNDEDDDAATPRPKPTKKPHEPVPNPPLRVAAFLAGAGFLESSYLAIEKLTGGEVTCPLTGCQTALNSGYSELFGVPLSAFGAAAYFGVAALTWWGAGMAGNEEDKDAYQRARVLTFLSTAGLAGVSSYLLYLLAVPLGGAECVYCLTSATISFTLFAIGLSGVGGKDFGKAAPAAFSVYIVTVLSLSLLLTDDTAAQANINTLKLPYAAPVIEAQSSSYSRDLATHLKSVGAKMYGAFWCSHCEDQKEIFGAGADIPYVECFPGGWERGTPVAAACASADIQGFPTWILADGTKTEGEKTLAELAKLSGFKAPGPGDLATAPGLDASSQLDSFLGQ